MTRQIQITAGETSFLAILNDSPTAEAIWKALPLEGNANIWGDEIYFSIPVRMDEAEDARQEMQVGELGYWPSGNAFCIFFGPTPVSDGPLPKAYSNVNPVGMIEGNAATLKRGRSGEILRIARVGT